MTQRQPREPGETHETTRTDTQRAATAVFLLHALPDEGRKELMIRRAVAPGAYVIVPL